MRDGLILGGDEGRGRGWLPGAASSGAGLGRGRQRCLFAPWSRGRGPAQKAVEETLPLLPAHGPGLVLVLGALRPSPALPVTDGPWAVPSCSPRQHWPRCSRSLAGPPPRAQGGLVGHCWDVVGFFRLFFFFSLKYSLERHVLNLFLPFLSTSALQGRGDGSVSIGAWDVPEPQKKLLKCQAGCTRAAAGLGCVDGVKNTHRGTHPVWKAAIIIWQHPPSASLLIPPSPVQLSYRS